jgi:hypothetical protein
MEPSPFIFGGKLNVSVERPSDYRSMMALMAALTGT